MPDEHRWPYSDPRNPTLEITVRNAHGYERRQRVLVDSGYTGFLKIDQASLKDLAAEEGLGPLFSVTWHCGFCVCDECRPDLTETERTELLQTGQGHRPVIGRGGRGEVILGELGLAMAGTIVGDPTMLPGEGILGKGCKNALAEEGWELEDTVLEAGRYWIRVRRIADPSALG